MPISSSDLAARQFRVTIGIPPCDSALKRPEIGPFGKVGTGLSVKSELATHFRRFSGRHQPRRAAFSSERDNNSGTPTRALRKCRKARFSGRSSRYVVRLARYIPAPSRAGNYCRVTRRWPHFPAGVDAMMVIQEGIEFRRRRQKLGQGRTARFRTDAAGVEHQPQYAVAIVELVPRRSTPGGKSRSSLPQRTLSGDRLSDVPRAFSML